MSMTDSRIQTFYDNAAAHGMTPGEYAIDLIGLAAILDVVEEARMEEAESEYEISGLTQRELHGDL